MNLKDYPHIVTALSPGHYEFDLLTCSEFAKDYLYYLNFARQLVFHSPFYIECAPFNSYLFLFTLEGNAKMTLEDKILLLKPQTAAFIDCHKAFKLELHECSSWTVQTFLLNGSSTPHYFKLFNEEDMPLCRLSPLSNIPAIAQKLINYTLSSSLENELMISKLITDLLTELVLAQKITPITHLPKYLLQIKTLFDQQYDQHFNLDELAQTYHISKYRLIKDFTTYLSKSPINYLIEKRISIAKKLLLETDYPVYQVASMVGIDNINHFTNLFKKHTQLTPNAFRKLNQLEVLEMEE